jgi:hypothetical protein
MRELNDIYSALMAAKASNEALESWARNADARDTVRNRERVINDGIAAYEHLCGELRDGRKHVEPPDDYKHTSCYCSAPTCSPPCSWCSDPENNKDEN